MIQLNNLENLAHEKALSRTLRFSGGKKMTRWNEFKGAETSPISLSSPPTAIPWPALALA